MYEGVEVALYLSSFREEKRDNNYTLLVRKDNGFPVVLYFVGYDRLFGSHYDEYVILYSTFAPGVDPSVFDIEKGEGRGSTWLAEKKCQYFCSFLWFSTTQYGLFVY